MCTRWGDGHRPPIYDLGRQYGLLREQRHLIWEPRPQQTHIAELDAKIRTTVAASREVRILASISIIGLLKAAANIAAIGHSDSVASAGVGASC